MLASAHLRVLQRGLATYCMDALPDQADRPLRLRVFERLLASPREALAQRSQGEQGDRRVAAGPSAHAATRCA